MKVYFFVLISSLIMNGGKFILDMAAIQVLDSSDYAEYGLISMLVIYILNSSLGMSQGLSILHSKPLNRFGRNEKKLKLYFFLAMIFFAISSLLFVVIIYLFHALNLNYAYLYLITFVIYAFNLKLSIKKMSSQFNSSNKMQLIVGIVMLTCSVFLFFNEAKLSHFFLVLLLAYSLGLFSNKFSFGVFNLKILFQKSIKKNIQIVFLLIRRGFPIMIVGLIYTLYTTIDRFIVGLYYDGQSFKNYSLYFLIVSLGHLIISIVASVNYTKFASEYYSSSDGKEVMKLHTKQKVESVILGFILAFVYIIALHLFGDYFFSSDILKLVIIGALSLPALSVINSITLAYNAIGRQAMLIPLNCLILPIYIIILMAAATLKIDIIYVSSISLINLWIIAFFLNHLSKKHLLRNLFKSTF